MLTHSSQISPANERCMFSQQVITISPINKDFFCCCCCCCEDMFLSDCLLYRSLLSKLYQASFKRYRITPGFEKHAIFTFSSFSISSKIFQIKYYISLDTKISITSKYGYISFFCHKVTDAEFKTLLLKCKFVCIYTLSR